MKNLVLTLISVFVFVSCGNNKSITETDPETGIKYEKIKDEYNVPHRKNRFLHSIVIFPTNHKQGQKKREDRPPSFSYF